MAMQLKGAAREWYMQLKERDPCNAALHDVEAWLAAVQEKFTDPNLRLQTMARLTELRQGTGSQALGKYIYAFNECIAILGTEKDPQHKFSFVRGLPPKLKEKCVLWGYTEDSRTLPEIQQMLERLEVTLHEVTYYYPSYQRNGGGQNRSGPTPMELGSTEMELGATQMNPENSNATRSKGVRRGEEAAAAGAEAAGAAEEAPSLTLKGSCGGSAAARTCATAAGIRGTRSRTARSRKSRETRRALRSEP